MRCSKSVVKFSGGMGGMAYVVEGGVMLCMFFLLPPPRLLEGGVFWQKYLPMVSICRIMCIMDAIMYADYL